MKILLYIFILLYYVQTIAQKTVIKKVDYNNQRIEVELEDIDLLEILHSDEQKVRISMQDYKEYPVEVDINSNNDVIKITNIKITSINNEPKLDKFCYEQPLFPSYKLILPKGCNIQITFKNGNFLTDNFNGNLDLQLETGDVTINTFNGSVITELFSGNILAKIKNTETSIMSNQGKITTNFPITNWQQTETTLKGTLGIKKNKLTVQSISANIVLNSSTTQ